MLFRYRARNYPESLSYDERKQWEKFRLNRLQSETIEELLEYARQLEIQGLDRI